MTGLGVFVATFVVYSLEYAIPGELPLFIVPLAMTAERGASAIKYETLSHGFATERYCSTTIILRLFAMKKLIMENEEGVIECSIG
ncbi:hypothetical protein [Haladaptatus sp. T7]|uniref:hypothetical protein n=1 Tax=Haladaptatus sp. T7 TaxID=2029368 RepID=UPI002230C62A|nr:hypothetical protein [Haladaptatus sp. T7]